MEGRGTMKILYSTKVAASGGRHGKIQSDDGMLSLNLALPKSLGGAGGATNPEQMFAGGYAACFENAILRVAREAKRPFADGDVEVVAEVGLSRNEADAYVLSVAMAITLAGVDQQTAEQLVRSADAICPYSNAIRGNIDVPKTIRVR